MEYHFDIKGIRANPVAFDEAMIRRGLEPKSPDILLLDATRRSCLSTAEQAQAERKDVSKKIGEAKKARNDLWAEALMSQVAVLKRVIDDESVAAALAEDKLMRLMLSLPNVPASDVPAGKDENDNVEIHRWGGPGSRDGVAHWDMNLPFGFIEASQISGARFSMLSGPVARLHRALGQWMLDFQIMRGYREVIPPTLVKAPALYGTGQLPKFEDDLFKTADHYLIPTAEVPLTNIVADRLMGQGTQRFVALSECYRAEAGSAGRDTRGLIRQHQFQKVELVSICDPLDSPAEHEYMVRSAELILEELELPYRRMLLCTGDMGFSAAKTYDLEVWLPGQNAYREISSVSNCHDFQARRMNARYRGDNGESVYAHTLNGSGLAVGRALVAVLENYITSEDFMIPRVLRPYMMNHHYLSQLDV